MGEPGMAERTSSRARQVMIVRQLVRRGIRTRVLAAMGAVPRRCSSSHRFAAGPPPAIARSPSGSGQRSRSHFAGGARRRAHAAPRVTALLEVGAPGCVPPGRPCSVGSPPRCTINRLVPGLTARRQDCRS